jgi:hypothetical protein
MPMSRKACVALVCYLPAFAVAFHAGVPSYACRRALGDLRMSTEAVYGSAPNALSSMKKISKVLSVGLEYSGKDLSPTELSILSMQIRKCKVSAIYTKEIDAIKEFASEQKSAVGSFPGPCLVIFNGSTSEAKDAFKAGASAVVLPASSVDSAASFDGEVIWKVQTAQDVHSVMEKTSECANVFLVDADEASRPKVAESIPTSALWIVVLDAMQLDGKEIDIAKQCKTQGSGSILVRNACVGDAEDLEYAQFCVGGVTSKASSEFKFSGLTGSTNGHFGGIQSNSSVKWRRLSL